MHLMDQLGVWPNLTLLACITMLRNTLRSGSTGLRSRILHTNGVACPMMNTTCLLFSAPTFVESLVTVNLVTGLICLSQVARLTLQLVCRSTVNSMLKPSPTRTRQSRPAYPPPVLGKAASEMNNVFEGLDQSGWAAFVQNLEELIEVRLSCIEIDPKRALLGIETCFLPRYDT